MLITSGLNSRYSTKWTYILEYMSRSLILLLYVSWFQIERWWREHHERLEKFFKFPLNELKDQGHYDSENETHR